MRLSSRISGPFLFGRHDGAFLAVVRPGVARALLNWGIQGHSDDSCRSSGWAESRAITSNIDDSKDRMSIPPARVSWLRQDVLLAGLVFVPFG